MTDYLNDLPSEIIWKILLHTSFRDILDFCQSNVKLNEICRDNYFWKLKIIQDFQIPSEFIDDINIWNVEFRELYEKLYSIENSIQFRSFNDNQYQYLNYINPNGHPWAQIYDKWLLVEKHPHNTIIDEKFMLHNVAPLAFWCVNNNCYRRLELHNYPVDVEYVYWPDYNVAGDINEIYNTFKSLGYEFVGPESGRLYFLSKGLLGQPQQYYPKLTLEYIRDNSVNPSVPKHREFIHELKQNIRALISDIIPNEE